MLQDLDELTEQFYKNETVARRCLSIHVARRYRCGTWACAHLRAHLLLDPPQPATRLGLKHMLTKGGACRAASSRSAAPTPGCGPARKVGKDIVGRLVTSPSCPKWVGMPATVGHPGKVAELRQFDAAGGDASTRNAGAVPGALLP